MKEKVLNTVKKLYNTSRFVKLICIAALCMIAIALSLVFSGARFAYRLNYGGNDIAVLSSKSVFDTARKNVLQVIEASDKEKLIYQPDFSLTLTLPDRIDSLETVQEAILGNTKELTPGKALCVDGKNTIILENGEELQSLVDERLAAYNVADYENKSEFIQKVELKDIYCKKSDYTNRDNAVKTLSDMSVKTTVKYTTDVETDFGTVTQKTASKLIGYCVVTVNGEKGLNHEVERVEMIDGVEVSREKLAQEVVRKPVDRVITVGTGTSSENGDGAKGMIFPLPKNTRTFISTYFGERDSGTHIHKGVDYVAAKGTPIYAVKGGTVTRSCYRSDYGNCIIINHGDGVQTLYAHCTELYVKVGEEVKQGQTIGSVGTTGQSTGYHLHFEVMVNGGYVNPTKYVAK
ncbi:MAG: peptidoglycan DD-metalloendopeptidase family protein [Clostridiales bacterium]|nr:peptidoglycan DD-metalloendopeptidase family protein [Candidatus Equinaster intestinalis]